MTIALGMRKCICSVEAGAQMNAEHFTAHKESCDCLQAKLAFVQQLKEEIMEFVL